MRSTASSIPVGGGTSDAGTVAGAGVTTRGVTTFAATVFSPTVFGATIVLLTSRPVRGSGRITVVTRAGSAALRMPVRISIKQNRIRMFRTTAAGANEAGTSGKSAVKANGIISL